MDNGVNLVRVSATTTAMNVEGIRRALEGYIGESLLSVKNSVRSLRILATENHFYEFFVLMNYDGSITLYDEDDRFSSYEECVSKRTRGCAIVERLANDLKGFDVKIECFGSCTLKGESGGVLEYTAYSESQDAIMKEMSR